MLKHVQPNKHDFLGKHVQPLQCVKTDISVVFMVKSDLDPHMIE